MSVNGSLTRAERVAVARRLRRQGLTYREIGERMGVAKSTASAYLDDPDLTKQWQRRTRYSSPCVDCGAPTDGSGGFARQRERCLACAARYAHEMRYWTPEAIIGALQAWTEDSGGIPPTASHWIHHGTPPGYPSVPTVQLEFGSWNAALRAAGLLPWEPSHYGRDGEDMELCREIRERYEAGESSITLAREYGCSPNAIRYRVYKAGGTLRPPGTYDRSRAAA